jgi:hypothetical protein
MKNGGKKEKTKEAIVHGTIKGNFKEEKFKIKIDENSGKISKWRPLKE